MRKRHLQPAAFKHAVAFIMDALLSTNGFPRRSSSTDWGDSAKDSKRLAISEATTSPMPQWAMSTRSRVQQLFISECNNKTAPSPMGLISISKITSAMSEAFAFPNAWANSLAPLLEMRLKLRRKCKNIKHVAAFSMRFASTLVHARIPWSPKLQCRMSNVSFASCSPARHSANLQATLEPSCELAYAKLMLSWVKHNIPRIVSANDMMASSSMRSARWNFTEKERRYFNSFRKLRDVEQSKQTSAASRAGRSHGRSKSGVKMPDVMHLWWAATSSAGMQLKAKLDNLCTL